MSVGSVEQGGPVAVLDASVAARNRLAEAEPALPAWCSRWRDPPADRSLEAAAGSLDHILGRCWPTGPRSPSGRTRDARPEHQPDHEADHREDQDQEGPEDLGADRGRATQDMDQRPDVRDQDQKAEQATDLDSDGVSFRNGTFPWSRFVARSETFWSA